MELSLVIPAYNESGILSDTLRTVCAALSPLAQDFEILVVDDGSTDATADTVRAFPDPRVRLVSYAPNRGKGCAVRTGMLECAGEKILCTDADLAYGTGAFGAFLAALDDHDLAVGSRRLHPDGYRDYPPVRLLASRCFGLAARLCSGLPYDTQCGIKAYRRDAAREIFRRCTTDGFAFDFEVLLRARRGGYRVAQIPAAVVNHRDSKVRLVRDSLRMFTDVVRIRRRVMREEPA